MNKMCVCVFIYRKRIDIYYTHTHTYVFNSGCIYFYGECFIKNRAISETNFVANCYRKRSKNNPRCSSYALKSPGVTLYDEVLTHLSNYIWVT